jgi:hypothetical protein
VKRRKQKAKKRQPTKNRKTFFVCRVLTNVPDRYHTEPQDIPDKLEYVVLERDGLEGRRDVDVASKGYATEAAANAVIKKLGGTIPKGYAMFLDFFDGEHGETVYCWQDERTWGASQTFQSEEEALDAWNNNKLIFTLALD